MTPRRTPVRVALLLLCATTLAATAVLSVTRERARSTTTAPGARPQFQTARCPFALGAGLVAGQDVRCGYLVVPEERPTASADQTRHGGTIRLAVAIFRGGLYRDPDPVVFLQGGPGGSLVSQVGPTITAATAPLVVGQRDLILLDQRGAGDSRPSLACPEFARPSAPMLAAARACRDRLRRAHVDLAAYTTAAMAADLGDLRRALGYRMIDVYGVSYGTRVALEAMQTDPTGLRSVILDSVEARQDNPLTGVFGAKVRAFDQLFAGCASDPPCRRAFPHLDATFDALVARLNAQPITIRVTPGMDGVGRHVRVLITGDDLVGLLFDALYQIPLIPSLPAMIARAARGDTRLLATLDGALAPDEGVNWGVYYSVTCGEDAPGVTPRAVVAAARALPATIRRGPLADSLTTLAICHVWPVPPVPPAQRRPVVSAIPTLVLAGQYDPVTPPVDGVATARTLRRSVVFTFPGLGHGVFLADPCATTTVEVFLDQPTANPDTGCAARMGGPHFLVP